MFEKWMPSLPIRPPDHFFSLKKVQMKFFPSYEHEKHVRIDWLVSNEYQRVWFAEKAKYDLLNYPMKDVKRQRLETIGPPFRIKKRFRRTNVGHQVIINRTRPPYRPELN